MLLRIGFSPLFCAESVFILAFCPQLLGQRRQEVNCDGVGFLQLRFPDQRTQALVHLLCIWRHFCNATVIISKHKGMVPEFLAERTRMMPSTETNDVGTAGNLTNVGTRSPDQFSAVITATNKNGGTRSRCHNVVAPIISEVCRATGL